MIVRCPACSTRFRLDRQRLGGKRIALRCVRCREIFRVEVAGTSSSTAVPVRVLVAHSDPELCGAVGEILSRNGILFGVCHDGPEALRRLEAEPPQVALLDVALPGLLAFELIDRIRRHHALQRVKVILLSSVYNRTAYKRAPTSLYGADDYLEKHHIPDDLVPKINRLAAADPCAGGSEAAGGAADPVDGGDEPAFQEEMIARIQRAEEGEVAARETGEALEKARRLARIIVSDIALYNQERVDEGIRSGRFFDLLAAEIAEGRRLFSERIAPEVRDREDFLGQAFTAFIARRQRELRP